MNDWIKIEKCTPRKPELMLAAKRCKASRADAFMAFFELWAYFDTHCETGFLPGLAPDDVDEIAGLPGFGDALSAAGWIVFDPLGLTIANWDRHNGKSSKARILKNRRQSKWRDVHVDAHVDAAPSTQASHKTSTRREEKRREAKQSGISV